MHSSHLIFSFCSFLSGSTMMLVGHSSKAKDHWAVLSKQSLHSVPARLPLDPSLVRDALTALLLLVVAGVVFCDLGSTATANPGDVLTFRVCLYAGLGFAGRFAWRLALRPAR